MRKIALLVLLYVAVLIAGCEGSLNIYVSASPRSGPAPLMVQFDCDLDDLPENSSSYVVYTWNFGDGQSAPTPRCEHIYTETGEYQATCEARVINEQGDEIDSYSKGVTVTVTEGEDQLPSDLRASIAANPTHGIVPLAVQFTSAVDGGRTPYIYAWNFGDTTSSNRENPAHVYGTDGTYTATLTVTDAEGDSVTSDGLSIAVGSDSVPTVSIDATPRNGPVPLIVQFSASAAGGNPPYTYTWTFGDGSASSSVQNPTHTFTDSGQYTAGVTVNDFNDDSASASVEINAGKSCDQDAGAGDCIGEDWDIPCAGRWVCEESACVEVCDYSSCGDESCDSEIGEGTESCPDDCRVGCQMPGDCIDRNWTQICQGNWTCSIGVCNQSCISVHCGNGVCEPDVGENGQACVSDCLDGPCQEIYDCFGYAWNGDGDCPGHWSCQGASGACESVCDAVGCGNGTCDVAPGGETPTNCSEDCADYDCNVSSDCTELTFPDGCGGGQWLCISRVCTSFCS
ncbi:MAG: PKD domain-containing protein [Proteobacteria bacterium]|nr:PKD domain-containing protein [Pseudomonadota bacterium]